METNCSCNKYEKMLNKIDSIIQLHAIRTENNHPLGKDYEPFKFCPWCGKRLKIKK